MKKILLGLIMVSVMSNADAETRWIGVSGTVENISVYETTDTILFTLSSAGETVSHCTNKTNFAISGTAPSDRRKQLLSVLLSSRASGKPVSVAYSDTECVPWDTNQNAYRRVRKIGQ